MHTSLGETGHRSYCGLWFQMSRDCLKHERTCPKCHDRIERESQERWERYLEECRESDL